MRVCRVFNFWPIVERYDGLMVAEGKSNFKLFRLVIVRTASIVMEDTVALGLLRERCVKRCSRLCTRGKQNSANKALVKPSPVNAIRWMLDATSNGSVAYSCVGFCGEPTANVRRLGNNASPLSSLKTRA